MISSDTSLNGTATVASDRLKADIANAHDEAGILRTKDRNDNGRTRGGDGAWSKAPSTVRLVRFPMRVISRPN